jgi:hypothetical protein
MTITLLATVLIIGGTILLILGTIPVKNTLDGNTLTVKYIIGKDTIDMTDAHFMPIPDEVNHNIIRIGGTSIGKIHSGNFMNMKTKTKYKFYLTGKGERHYFEIGDKKYLVDDIDVPDSDIQGKSL